jgi:mechanosensitive ion channel protein 1/2/3
VQGWEQVVEGFVLDIGWYRTTIRSFEREIFNIPNSVFSRNVVLNITRKEQQWRFFEFLGAVPSLESPHALGGAFG